MPMVHACNLAKWRRAVWSTGHSSTNDRGADVNQELRVDLIVTVIPNHENECIFLPAAGSATNPSSLQAASDIPRVVWHAPATTRSFERKCLGAEAPMDR